MTQDHAEIAALFRASMPPEAETLAFRIDPLDRLGIPVVQANLLTPDRPTVIGHGYGFTEAEAATGALGELCEEVHLGTWLKRQEPVEASYAALLARLGPSGVADPLTLCLPAGSDYDPQATRRWLPARRYPSDDTVLVPIEWVAIAPYQLGGRAGLITPITNGLGAGLDLDHAIAHGVMELLQRDGNVLTYRAFDQGAVVSLDAPLDPDCESLCRTLREAGIDVTVKLAGTGFGIANLYVVGDDHGEAMLPIQITACGEAAHPNRMRGLRKALLEFVGSRSRKAATHGPIELLRDLLPPASFARQMAVAEARDEEPRALDTMADWVAQDEAELRRRLVDTVFLRRTEAPFSSLPDVSEDLGQSRARLDWLSRRLRDEGLEILWVDCSPAGSPVRAVKVIVPGLESETMSYGRIGWRGVRRLRDRGDALLSDRPAAGYRLVRLRSEDAERAGGAAFLDTDGIDARVEQVYPLYREANPLSAQLALRRRRDAGAAGTRPT